MKKYVVGFLFISLGALIMLFSEDPTIKKLGFAMAYLGLYFKLEGIDEFDSRIKKLERKIEDEENAF